MIEALLASPPYMGILSVLIREGGEIGLVMTSIYLIIQDDKNAMKQARYGIIAGLVILGLWTMIAYMINMHISQHAQQLYKVMMMIIAVLCMTTVIVWSYTHAHRFYRKLQDKLKQSVQSSQYLTIGVLMMTTILREGGEIVLMLGTMDIRHRKFLVPLLLSAVIASVIVVGACKLLKSRQTGMILDSSNLILCYISIELCYDIVHELYAGAYSLPPGLIYLAHAYAVILLGRVGYKLYTKRSQIMVHTDTKSSLPQN